jgi:hypothetical protein
MIKIKLIVVLLGFNVVLYGQKTLSPILYVYDTIIIHDTIRIKKPRLVQKLPTLLVEKPFEMPPTTATFSTKSIIHSKQLLVPKKKEMKKNILWAMMLWTLPDLWSQNHINLTIGGGVHEIEAGYRVRDLQATTYTENAVNRLMPLSPHLQMGVHLFRYALKKQLIYGMGLDYQYMFSTQYQTTERFYFSDPLYVRRERFYYNSNLWSLPIYAQWNTKFVKPLLGVILDYQQLSTNWDPWLIQICDLPELVIPNAPKPVTDLKLSLQAGLEMPLSNKYAIRLNYVHPLLSNERWAVRWNESYEKSDYKVRKYRLDLTFVLHLKEF